MADTKTSDISVPKHRKDVQASYLGLARETRQRILKYTVEASLSTSTWRSDHQDCFKFLDNLRCTHDSVKNDLSLPLKQVSNDLRAKIIKDERLFQWVMDLDVGKLDPTKVEIKEFENQGDIDEDELDSAIAAKKSAKEVIDFWICGSKGHPKVRQTVALPWPGSRF